MSAVEPTDAVLTIRVRYAGTGKTWCHSCDAKVAVHFAKHEVES